MTFNGALCKKLEREAHACNARYGLGENMLVVFAKLFFAHLLVTSAEA